MPTAMPEGPPDTGLAEKVRFLASPEAYPSRPSGVAAVETHMSWVFLAGDEVFKLKKPVRTPYLDFSTIEARHLDCLEEVRLNRRLAPDVYLGVAPLVREPGGGLLLGGQGREVDWLVRMRRLPRERMMDRTILTDGLTPAHLDALARVLSGFHASLPPAGTDPEDYYGRFARQHVVDQDVLERYRDRLDGPRLEAALLAARRFLDDEGDLLRERAAGNMVVEGHGDLRPDHVCLLAPPVVIDCLEFNRELRLVDPYEELSCLGLECARLGKTGVAETLYAFYQFRLGGRPPERLAAFYVVSRALLRAQLALSRYGEPGSHPPEHWPLAAGSSLALAGEAVRTLSGT